MNSELFQTINTIATALTGLIAVVTFYKAYLEYKLSNTQKRVELFERYRNNLKDNESYANILNLIEEDDTEILNLPLVEKYQYIGFFEEIALLVNSKVLKPEIAHYMFGYLAIACWTNDKFWYNLSRDGIYWRVFKEFVETMEIMKAKQFSIPENQNLNFKL